ncbi:MAG: ester cyclase [Candidatus Thiosymbion ectosymbiont of Robbea hypermnestra]|nr:ester cyclase [Candidatus Thiosymbion ectosymbiont of Robbea hypermnestra]
MAENETPIQIQDRETVLDSDSAIVWRYGKRPDYSKTDRTLRAQARNNHPKGSLEDVVQNLVRTFEVEATYKLKPEQWTSIVLDEFRMVTNNCEEYTAEDIVAHGTYNLFLGESEVYSSKAETFESSNELFKSTFPTGFIWEVEEVYSGPPKVVFKWRHWGKFEGPFKGHQPTEKIVEITGISIADVTEDLKIRRVEHFFDTRNFLGDLTSGDKCPFVGGTKTSEQITD